MLGGQYSDFPRNTFAKGTGFPALQQPHLQHQMNINGTTKIQHNVISIMIIKDSQDQPMDQCLSHQNGLKDPDCSAIRS